MLVKVQGVKVYKKGAMTYAYCRQTGKRLENVPVKKNGRWYGDAEMVAELLSVRQSIPKQGTVQDLVTRYKEHDVSVRGRRAFCDLAERTRQDYAMDLGRLCGAKLDGNALGDIAVTKINVNVARNLRDHWNRALGARTTSRIMAACSVLWSYGMEYSLVKTNPWKAIKAPERPKHLPRKNPPWLPDEVMKAVETAPFLGLRRFYVLAFLGIRPEQIPSLTWSAISNFDSSKTEKTHQVTIPKVFSDHFESMGSSVLVSTGPEGLPWLNYGQVGREFGKHRRSLVRQGLMRKECTLKALNHTMGAACADLGYTDAEISASMARTRETAHNYSDRGDIQKMSNKVFGGLSDWLLSTTEADLSTGEA